MIRILFFFVICHSASAQDERFYQDVYKGTFSEKIEDINLFKIRVSSSKYMIDLNRDSIKDSFQIEKRDGLDAVVVNDSFGERVFEATLIPKGANSKIFKASFVKISKNVDVLLLHYYEGDTQTSTFEGSARLYFITIKDRKLKDAKLTKGPYFWSEKEKAAGKYWARRYSVNTIDYNNDGFKEISVSYNKISRIYFLNKIGLWVKI